MMIVETASGFPRRDVQALPCLPKAYASATIASTMMQRFFSSLLVLAAASAFAADDYQPGPDSLPQAGVAKGEMLKDKYVAKDGSVFPGTEREYQIYLPVGLDTSKPAPFMVFQDGVIYQAPTVFDNLIAKKEIPPLIGIFVKPGVVPAANDNALPRFNRSYEYDSVTDSYSRFLIDEFLPAIKAKHKLNLSDDPNARGIAGSSSGGICAFMVAWHRPDQFRRVFTSVGTYVGIHGADQLPVLVRKHEPKPLKIYLQSGENDNNLYCGDWWMANQTMERSLSWNGYDVNHTWGTGGHNGKHATAIFPEVLRWLWKGYPEGPIKANPRGDAKWRGYEVIGDGAWAQVLNLSGDYLNVDTTGEVKATNQPNARCVRHDGKTFAQAETQGKTTGMTLSPDQTLLYVAHRDWNYLECHQVKADGTLSHRQLYGQLDPLLEAPVEPKGMCVDTNGWLYVATSLGIQVLDQAGRVNFILPTPKPPIDVCFGGKDLSELFIACGDTIYQRPTKAKGVVSGQQAPIKPPAPKL